jgi:hypothetical protein
VIPAFELAAPGEVALAAAADPVLAGAAGALELPELEQAARPETARNAARPVVAI